MGLKLMFKGNRWWWYGIGVSMRMLIEGQPGFIFAYWAASLFIPSLALGLSSISSLPRLIEAIYLIW